MAGVISDALRKAGYLAPGLDSLSAGLEQYMQKEQRKKGLESLAQYLNTAQGSINDAFNPYQSNTPFPSSGGELNPSTNAISSNIASLRNRMPQQLNTYDRRPVQPDQYNQAANSANNSIFQFLKSAGTDLNVNPAMANSYAQALQLLIPQKPQAPKPVELNYGSQLIDPASGRMIANNPRVETPKEISGEYKNLRWNSKTGTYWGQDPKQGYKFIDTGIKDATKYESGGSGSDKTLSLEDLAGDLGRNLADLKYFKENWGQMVGNADVNEQNPDYKRVKANLAQISREAKQRGKDYIKGYDKISGVLWAKQQSGASKEEILQEIDSLPVPAETKDLLKIEFNSGIY